MTPDRQEPKKNKNMWMALWPLLFLGLAFQFGSGQSSLTKTMGINQRVGDSVPKDLMFKDEDGNNVRLGDFFKGRPVVLVPIFYSCKTGCAILTDNIMKTLAKATSGDILKPGRDMDVLMYSIDPVENPDLAHARKALIMNSLTPHLSTPAETAAWRGEAEKGWHLLTGNEASIHLLSDSIGFKYNYRTVPDLEHTKTVNLINHPTCTVILTPDGRISRYTIGNGFQTKEVEAFVAGARKGEIAPKADQSMMFGCIMIDPATGRNRLVVENIWRLCGALTVLVLAGSVISMFVKSHRENLASGGRLSPR
jgi:protein SCO1/2